MIHLVRTSVAQVPGTNNYCKLSVQAQDTYRRYREQGRRRTMRSHTRTAFYFVCVGSVIIWWSEHLWLRRGEETWLQYSGYLFETPGCMFPHYEPVHWSIVALYQNNSVHETFCDKLESLVVFRNRNVPVLNEWLLARRYKLRPEKVLCFYADILRNESARFPDNETFLGPQRLVRFGKPVGGEFIFLWCEEMDGNKLFSSNFMVAQRKANHQAARAAGQLNVLILGLDATSRLNTIRQLPRTRRFLKQELNAFEFEGYSKVGLNSFPNLMALLTGLSGDAVRESIGDSHFDDLEHLMSVYRRRQYLTLFLEEIAHAGIFLHPVRNGFRKPPADYYPNRIFLKWRNATETSCAIVRYTTEVLSLKGQKIFAFVWLGLMSHDDMNSVGYMDKPLDSMLRSLHASGFFDDTALLMVGDHGLRYGPSLQTEIGREEDKTPFCLLALPGHFLRQHPEAAAILEVNQRRLTTAYDMHATLLTLSELPRFRPMRTERGVSLFLEITPDRTCADAFVPPEYCPCANPYTVAVPYASAEMRRLAFAAVVRINEIARDSFPGLCQEFRLMRVEKAAVTEAPNGELSFRLTLFTSPEAIFVVLGTDDARRTRLTVIERLDAHRNQTMCLPTQVNEMVCRCNSLRW